MGACHRRRQCHEQLGLLVVAEVIQLLELGLEHEVRVTSQRKEELRNPLDRTPRQGLDDAVILGER